MDETSCQICFCDYGGNLVPKTLGCGHSFCNECLSNILKTDLKCPQCRESISADESQHPTCFDFLSLIEKYRELKMSSEEFQEKYIVPLREKLLDMKVKLEYQRNQVFAQEKKLNERIEDITNDISTLDTIKISPENGGIADAVKSINCLKKKILKSRDPVFSFSRLPEVSFRLDDFENGNDFLYEIYGKITNGEKLYATARVEENIKYGKLEIFGSKLFIYSLSLTEDQIEANATIILFQEIKSCLIPLTIQTFLKVNCNKNGLAELLIIELTNHHSVPLFIKLCTGESGPSFKGSEYEKVENAETFNLLAFFTHNGNNKRENMDYQIEVKHSVSFVQNECIVVMGKNSEFAISKMNKDGEYTTIIGKVITLCELLLNNSIPATARKIKDCGIVASLK